MAQDAAQAETVTGVDPGIIACPRHGHVCQARVDEIPIRARAVDVDQDTVGRGSLGAVARHCIAVVEMWMFADAECDRVSGVETDSQTAAGVDLLDRPELTVRHALVLVWCGELDAVSGGELSLALSVDRNSLEAARIVGKLLAVVASDRQEIAVAVDADHADVLAGCDT